MYNNIIVLGVVSAYLGKEAYVAHVSHVSYPPLGYFYFVFLKRSQMLLKV